MHRFGSRAYQLAMHQVTLSFKIETEPLSVLWPAATMCAMRSGVHVGTRMQGATPAWAWQKPVVSNDTALEDQAFEVSGGTHIDLHGHVGTVLGPIALHRRSNAALCCHETLHVHKQMYSFRLLSSVRSGWWMNWKSQWHRATDQRCNELHIYKDTDPNNMHPSVMLRQCSSRIRQGPSLLTDDRGEQCFTHCFASCEACRHTGAQSC